MKDQVATEDQTEEMSVLTEEMIEGVEATEDLQVVETEEVRVARVVAVEEEINKKRNLRNNKFRQEPDARSSKLKAF